LLIIIVMVASKHHFIHLFYNFVVYCFVIRQELPSFRVKERVKRISNVILFVE